MRFAILLAIALVPLCLASESFGQCRGSSCSVSRPSKAKVVTRVRKSDGWYLGKNLGRR